MHTMKKTWRCIICGYVHTGEEPPESCQICGAGREEFELDTVAPVPVSQAAYWRCLNCEYVHAGDAPPDICKVCGASRDAFEAYNPLQSEATQSDTRRLVIIGSGIAGLTAAEEARRLSPGMEITLISEENHLPYYRLNLTRYLAKAVDRPSLIMYPPAWFEENRITLLTGEKVSRLHPAANEVVLGDGRRLPYDKMIIAMGAHPFIPPFAGSTLSSVITLRTIDDADGILRRLSSVDSCICIGGGVLGLEIAGAIAAAGVKVTVLEGSEWLMPRQLNKAAAACLTRHLAKIGVTVLTGARTQEITASGETSGVLLSSGEQLAAGLVIIAAGVRPNTHLARKAGLEVHNGLVVDNHMRTTDPHIYAAGDITEHYGILYGLWNIAQFQGKIAARNALGHVTEFGGIPRSNVLKVLDVDVFSIGEISAPDASYSQWEKSDGEKYFMFLIRDNKLVGSIIIGDKAVSLQAKQAVEKGTVFAPEHLQSADSLLAQIARS